MEWAPKTISSATTIRNLPAGSFLIGTNTKPIRQNDFVIQVLMDEGQTMSKPSQLRSKSKGQLVQEGRLRYLTADPVLPFEFCHHPTSLRIWGEWRRKRDVLANTESPHSPVGPRANAIRRADGSEEQFVFIGQPKASPLQDHLLLVAAREIPHASGADVPTAIFFGGRDDHENKQPASARMLAFMYPVER